MDGFERALQPRRDDGRLAVLAVAVLDGVARDGGSGMAMTCRTCGQKWRDSARNDQRGILAACVCPPGGEDWAVLP